MNLHAWNIDSRPKPMGMLNSNCLDRGRPSEARRPSPAHCLYLQIKFYWNREKRMCAIPKPSVRGILLQEPRGTPRDDVRVTRAADVQRELPVPGSRTWHLQMLRTSPKPSQHLPWFSMQSLVFSISRAIRSPQARARPVA